MNAAPTVAAAATAEPHGVPQLRTILLTDLVDSTALVERLGDGAAAELFRAHDRLVLQLQNHWRGRLIDRSDGLLLLFERPIDGLGFALDYFRGLRELGAPHGADIKARAGLHVGEVLSWRNSDEAVRVGAKPLEVEGLAKPMAARLMTMARPGQLLMSAVAEPLAHRAARELGERGQHLLWKSHGHWRFKGVPEPQQIFEVGEPGVTPLRAPQTSPKAWRDIPLWRRPLALATELALVAAIGLGIWLASRPQPAIAFNQRDWVVLADLRNLTDQPLLDDSLEQAFRISLEQSRHVNVLSDLKTRDTLARMQRAPDTELDRAIASEIAIRDGARAVILPTVAEVGGRVRVSAEVIDPHSQTTVYAEYADGKGAVSALASIDTVTAALREKLGEALEAVEQDSAPLPEVTTENLDALRAYALGLDAYARRKRAEALELFKRAIELDPAFALAHLGCVRVYVGAGDLRSAKLHSERALQLRHRLPPKEQLYLDAWIRELGPRPHESISSWKALATLYPDEYAGPANYAIALFERGQYDSALDAAKKANAAQNPFRSFALNTIGRSQLAKEDYESAISHFSQAAKIEGHFRRQYAAALAATRQFDEALLVMQQLYSEGLESSQISNQFETISIQVDRGEWEKAIQASSDARKIAEDSPLFSKNFQVIQLSVDLLHDPAKLNRQRWQEALEDSLAGVRNPDNPERAAQLYIALAAVYLMQRAGEKEFVESALASVTPIVSTLDDPNTTRMIAIINAGNLRIQGKTAEAVSKLEALVDGSELFQTHVALRDALKADGRHADALKQNRWLASNRGRAYMEGAGALVLQVTNVADTTLAHLDAAEMLAAAGDAESAGRELANFKRAWSDVPDHLRRRVGSIFPASKQ